MPGRGRKKKRGRGGGGVQGISDQHLYPITISINSNFSSPMVCGTEGKERERKKEKKKGKRRER